MTNKLILGTVQFGQTYGISNSFGLPAEKDVINILSMAITSGIDRLDTAPVYGLAEKRIGIFNHNSNRKFNIITKFSKNEILTWNISLQNSLEQMKIKKLETIMFHSFKEYFRHKKDLVKIAQVGKGVFFDKIGVSTYTNDEIEELLKDDLISVIQMPYNLLDNKMQRGEILKKLKRKGKEVHARSCFLQGLFFMESDKVPEHLAPLSPFLEEIKNFARSNNLEVGHLAIQYALNNCNIDGVLIGVETIDQLRKNIDWANNSIDSSILNEIDSINVSQNRLLNPSLW